jgi:hypothetical protein
MCKVRLCNQAERIFKKTITHQQIKQELDQKRFTFVVIFVALNEKWIKTIFTFVVTFVVLEVWVVMNKLD